MPAAWLAWLAESDGAGGARTQTGRAALFQTHCVAALPGMLETDRVQGVHLRRRPSGQPSLEPVVTETSHH